jgi:hypothetical protein
MIHPHVEEAFQTIDAGVFSDDALDYDDFRDRLLYFIARWQLKVEAVDEEKESEG